MQKKTTERNEPPNEKAENRSTGEIVHEINNLLAGILIHSELVLEAIPKGGPIHKDIQTIQSAIRSVMDLTSQLEPTSEEHEIKPRPMNAGTSIEHSRGISPETDEQQRGATILLVDDEEIVLNSTKRMLTRMGFDVLAAKDGSEAIDIFEKHAGKINLVLLDLTMPNMNGYEAFQEIHKINSDTPVILSSAYSRQEIADRYDCEEFADYIQKPYEFDVMAQRIREALNNQEIAGKKSERFIDCAEDNV